MKDYATIRTEIAEKKEELAVLKAKKLSIIGQGQGWRLRNGEDSREVTNVSLAELNKEIAQLEREIAQLEGLLGGGNPSGIRISARVL